ncbi:MAG: ABC transporter permease, partial [Halobacteria archaeon]|nr:ABC transporter permease [Halobacteria archaeon]
ALVGTTIAEQFSLELGNRITVGNESYRVQAILEDEGFSPVSPNFAVVVPESEIDLDGYSQVVVEAPSGSA